ncbi:hypothetical protein CS0771_07860 [Catellatospora sp. IY07-71]|uniref:MSCRAMM family protein n=1 Tax=Catellatospora sp. IY07-71 TaxID=2728827 RepID=UPI001BB3EA71|nr:carboxypeptidase-like regulatory domain-containing protein [Catellatospora sp. IY07-71]BCJ71242.1 hypothetical protein CS0771_07860 [Catellatospora sp. IY07-71]
MRRAALAALAILAAAVVIPASSQAAPSPAAAAPSPATAAAPRAAAPAAGRISGRVTDVATGTPIAGACVTAYYYTAYQVHGYACTDADGGYTMDNVQGGNFYLQARLGEQTLWWPGVMDRAFASGVSTFGTAVVADFAIERRTGTVRGTLTRQDGGAAWYGAVRLYRPGATQAVVVVTTLDGGSFVRAGVPAGEYQVAFGGSGYATQWYPGKADRAEAATVTVTEGGTVELTEQFRAVDPMPALPEMSTVHGTVTAAGTPVADARVDLFGLGMLPLGGTRTDGEGRYQIPNVRTGIPVWTRTTAPGYATTWSIDDPEPYTQRTVGSAALDVKLGAKPGRLTVRVVDHDGALPFPGTTLTLTDLAGTWTYTMPVRFDGTADLPELPQGEYQLKVLPRVPSGVSRPAQWYPGKLTAAEAQTVTVTGGATTALTETLVGPAVVEVTLLDAVTGAPVSGACVQMADRVCADDGGVYRLRAQDLQKGPRQLYVTHEPYHYPMQSSAVAGPGEVVKVTLRIQPGAVITTTYRDTINKTELPPVCVHAVRGTWGDKLADNRVCAQPDADGRLLLGPFQPGQVQLFVEPRDLIGAQWLGRTGGTGDRHTAALLDLRTGEITDAPEIVVQRGRAISGTLRRAENGQLATTACATAGPELYSCPGDGLYRLDNLGPYDWKITYSDVTSPAIRTGEQGAPARTDLTAASVSGADAWLSYGTWVPVAVAGATAPTQITAYDAYTGITLSGASGGSGVRVPANRAVVLRAQHGDTVCWAYFGLGNRRTPYLAVGTEQVKQITLTIGKNCLAREPFRSPVRMRPLPGPVVVKTFAGSPWLRGVTGRGVDTSSPTVSSPWGVPTDARLARVKN